MKKYILKYMFLGAFAVSALTSCEMDQSSPANLRPEEGLTSIADAESWRMGLYSTARSTYSAPNVFLSDIALDQFVATKSYGNFYGPTARWSFGNGYIDDQTTVWANFYTLINRANEVIDKVPLIAKNAELSAADTRELNQIIGEAYLMRAIGYQTLATYFCDRYDAAKAKEQKGLSIVVKVDEHHKPVRQSLDSTYNFIQEDLDSARVRMNDNNRSASYVHNPQIFQIKGTLTTSVIDLVEARVALTTGNYAKAAALATGLIDSQKYPLITTAKGLTDMWTNDEGPEIIFQCFQNKDERGASWSDLGKLNLTYTNHYGRDIYEAKYIVSAEAIAAYEDTDIRFPGYFRTVYTKDAVSSQTIMLNKYPGNPALKKNAADVYNTAKPFRVAEAYLIAAEAYYKNGEPDKALAVFNALHATARGASEVTDIAGFEQVLADEYLREYIGEGLAFSAYKRLSMPVVRGSRQQSIADQTSKAVSITPDNKRWTWEIPQQDLFANPNIENNWQE